MNDNNKKESFIFYRSFHEGIQAIKDKTIKCDIYEAICNYCLYGKEPDKDSFSKAYLLVIKPTIDKTNARYSACVENGKKGGRPKKEKNLKKPKENQKQKNENLYEEEDVYVEEENNNNILLVEDKKQKIVKEIINYMNELAGTSYKATTKKTQSLINARLKEGFSVDDFKDVIYFKYHEWYKNPVTFQNGVTSDIYFRPNTLFSNNFEGYLEDYRKKYTDVGENE